MPPGRGAELLKPKHGLKSEREDEDPPLRFTSAAGIGGRARNKSARHERWMQGRQAAVGTPGGHHEAD